MAKTKDKPTEPDEIVAADAAATGNASEPAGGSSTPAKRKYRVSTAGITPHVVEAVDEGEAVELYKAWSGVTASDHGFAVADVEAEARRDAEADVDRAVASLKASGADIDAIIAKLKG